MEKAYIDKIYGSNHFRIIIDYGDEQDESMLVHFVGRFVPKNNDSDSDDNDELVDIRQLLPHNNDSDYYDYNKIITKFKENDYSDE